MYIKGHIILIRGNTFDFAESNSNQVHHNHQNTVLDIIFGVSIFITLLIILIVILAVIGWLVRRKNRKVSRSEPIALSSLQEADENAYEKIHGFNTSSANVSLSKKDTYRSDTECSDEPERAENDM